jgi:putative membrane-bound dehydrogenase-like protein
MRLPFALALLSATAVNAADGNRLMYLDECDPYYPHRTFPKLITPQWVGEPGVEAVVILAIDDMRGHEKWEAYLRPILDRLKKIDGRAPVSIMTCKIDPADPHLQTWLKEGLSLEVHTVDHPCPLFAKGDFAAAKSTYDRCVDQMAAVPNSKPVAFRTPCCDSLNTVSPRFFAEIFNKTTEKGNFLQADSSVFNVFTPNDPDLKREWVTEGDGRSRFAKYLPADRDFVNTIEDYPYPYVINRLCWEFPCATPSDWQAQFRQKAKNELTLRDWYACLDATVKKQGTMNFVFHPYDWMDNKQIVQFIDYAQETYGKRIKFLTFREAVDRLTKNVLNGHPLRDPKTGADNGVRLLDVNNDGYMDVVIGNAAAKVCRTWDPKKQTWTETAFPLDATACRFGIVHGATFALADTADGPKAWVAPPGFTERGSEQWAAKLAGRLPEKLAPFRLLDLNGDGNCEVIADGGAVILTWNPDKKAWDSHVGRLPGGAVLPDGPDRDTGVRFVDLKGDGHLDLLVSHEGGYAGALFSGFDNGWPSVIFRGTARDPNPMMPFADGGTNNGAFLKNRHVYWVNEHTDGKPDHLEKWSFNSLLTLVPPTAKTPEQSLKMITVRPGYTVELAAQEPQVQDPIAIAWGPDGKLWVVEMGDYPLGVDGKGKFGGKILFLESTKSDGRYDKATTFIDGIGFPTGILPWRKGVLICAAPDIYYAEDTDGDGKADKIEKLFTGFNPGNQQHRVNGLVWGLDNWVYCANGDSGGVITSVKTGKTLDMRGRDIRIRPDTGEMELTSGQSQYAKIRDDWGNWFGANNSLPGWHVVLEDRQLARNPTLAAPQTIKYLQPVSPPVYPTSRTLPRFNEPGAANRFTSACGIGTYRDDLFEPALRRALFTCEPVHNLVHRMDLVPDGPTFTGRRAVDEPRSEFLSSADNWFRPVMARTGPDGCLYVVDMYRAVIEHPEWIPKEIQAQLDLRAGHDMGRIYRVSRIGVDRRPIPNLAKLDTAALVASLDTPNGWQRDMAHMLLVWTKDEKAVEPLEKMVHESKNPLARLHALAALDGMNALKPEVLRAALADEHPGVLAQAVRLCESRFAADPELGPAMLKLVNKPEVALPLAGALGGWDDPRAGAAIGTILKAHGENEYVAATALSSLTPKNFAAVADATMSDPTHPPLATVVERLLAFAVAKTDETTLGKMLAGVAPKEGPFTTGHFHQLASLLDALERQKKSLADLAKTDNPALKAAVEKLGPAFAQARSKATDAKARPADRVAAVTVLGRNPAEPANDRAVLVDLLGPQSPGEVQAAAVAGLARTAAADTPAVLLKGWKGYSPSVRAAVLSALLARTTWVPAVLTAIEKKEVLPAEVDAAARQQLLTHKIAAVRETASKLLAGGIDADRAKVIATYKPALTKQGDRERGKQVFTKTCSACHKVGDIGKGLGPDLAALSDKSAEYLLVNILDPNRAVEARYLAYTANTTDGRSRVGFLSAETATSITLVSTDGQEHTILRTDLESLVGSGKSVMPEGLEKDVSIDQMADLLAFLRSALPAPKPKEFAGNKPERIAAAEDGSLTLRATAAEIYGTTLVFEPQYRNLGWWSNADDRAVWTIAVSAAGKYEVWIDWACPKEEAGKLFTIEAGGESLSGRVGTTAGWEEYRQAKVGEIALEPGDTRLTVRASLPFKGILMDLRTLKLLPIKDGKK